MQRLRHIEILFFLLFIISCEKEKFNQQITKPTDCDSTFFTFEKNIRPIFNANCNFRDCHATSGKGSYDFTQYSTVAARVRAGAIDYRLDLPLSDPQHMPEDMKLSPCDYFIIKTWIKQGFVKN